MADSLTRLKTGSVAQTGLTYLPLKSLFSFGGNTHWRAQHISLGFAGRGNLILNFLKGERLLNTHKDIVIFIPQTN